jgi:hypothetical protein
MVALMDTLPSMTAPQCSGDGGAFRGIAGCGADEPATRGDPGSQEVDGSRPVSTSSAPQANDR